MRLTATALAALALLAACGGGGGSTATTNAPATENTGNPVSVQGVSTPSSVAVVTAN